MRAAILFVLLAASCSRRAQDKTTRYSSPDLAFQAELPARWRVDERRRQDGPETLLSVFYGPPDGPRAMSQRMSVSFHAASDPSAAARRYAVFRSGSYGFQFPAPPVAPKPVRAGGLAGWEAVRREQGSSGPESASRPGAVTTRIIVLPTARGFYDLEHRWPGGDAPDPAFDRLLSTFRPAPE